MKHEFDITLKFTKEEIKEIEEKVKSGYIDEVYSMFKCQNTDTTRYVYSRYCGRCHYLYKIDIRAPGVIGCHVKDYINKVKSQNEVNELKI
jgi:hypothetical protein